MPFDFHGANVYFLIDKLERLAYKARRFPAGLPTMPKQRGPHVRQKKSHRTEKEARWDFFLS